MKFQVGEHNKCSIFRLVEVEWQVVINANFDVFAPHLSHEMPLLGVWLFPRKEDYKFVPWWNMVLNSSTGIILIVTWCVQCSIAHVTQWSFTSFSGNSGFWYLVPSVVKYSAILEIAMEKQQCVYGSWLRLRFLTRIRVNSSQLCIVSLGLVVSESSHAAWHHLGCTGWVYHCLSHIAPDKPRHECFIGDSM